MIYLNSVLDSTQQKASENMHLTELPKKSWASYSEHVVSLTAPYVDSHINEWHVSFVSIQP